MRIRNRATIQMIIVNLLTFSRFLAAGFVLFLAAKDRWWLVLVCSFSALVSDWLDGFLARRWRVESDVGKFFDPLADKAISLAVLWTAANHYDYAWPYLLTAIIASIYDISLVSARVLYKGKSNVVVGASKAAKAKTAVLLTTLLVLIIGVAGEGSTFSDLVIGLGYALLTGSVLLMIVSWYQYRRLLAVFVGNNSQIVQGLRIEDVDFAALKKRGIEAIIFDIEGTITEWSGNWVDDKLIQCIASSDIQKIGIVTNISKSQSSRVSKIAHQIQAEEFVYPRSVFEKKPSSRMIKDMIQKLGVRPSQTVMFGDKIHDVVAGSRAGLDTIFWVPKRGQDDHWFDRYFYRPLEPMLRKIVS